MKHKDIKRLAVLLHKEWCDHVGHPTHGVCHDIAARLVAAGVTLAITHAPLKGAPGGAHNHPPFEPPCTEYLIGACMVTAAPHIHIGDGCAIECTADTCTYYGDRYYRNTYSPYIDTTPCHWEHPILPGTILRSDRCTHDES
jgi:hypothetical protein